MSSTVFGTSEEKIGTTPKRGNGWGGQMVGFELYTQLDSNVWLLPGGISKRYEEVSCMKESGVIKVHAGADKMPGADRWTRLLK